MRRRDRSEGAPTHAAETPASGLRALLRALSLREVRTRLRSRYRPELHYMRGPGPKCAERARSRPPK